MPSRSPRLDREMPAAASPLALMSHLSDGAAVRVLRARATFFGVGAVGVIRLELPGELRYRHVVLRAVGVACKAATADASDECDSVAAVTSFVSQVVTAVGEAFNNVVLHGYAGDRSGTVCVAVEIGIGFVRLIIEDMGESWDPLQVGTPNLEALPESGMGVFIMRSFMDEVAYRPGRPNVLTMTKRMG